MLSYAFKLTDNNSIRHRHRRLNKAALPVPGQRENHSNALYLDSQEIAATQIDQMASNVKFLFDRILVV